MQSEELRPGYNDLDADTKAAVTELRQMEERILRRADELQHSDKPDQRWVSTGRDLIEQAFMAFNRSLTQPRRIVLPEDGEGWDL